MIVGMVCMLLWRHATTPMGTLLHVGGEDMVSYQGNIIVKFPY